MEPDEIARITEIKYRKPLPSKRSDMKVFTEKLVNGLEANTDKLDENIQKNSILVTALVPKLGYDIAAEVAKEAIAENKTIKTVLLDRALLPENEIDELLDIEKLI